MEQVNGLTMRLHILFVMGMIFSKEHKELLCCLLLQKSDIKELAL